MKKHKKNYDYCVVCKKLSEEKCGLIREALCCLPDYNLKL